MKIHSTEKVLRNLLSQETKKIQGPDNGKFGKVLQETINRSSDAKSGLQGPLMMNKISEIRFDPISPLDKTSIVDRVENFLDILDEYHKKLGDPKASLKDISPLVDDMTKEREGLMSSLHSLSDGDKLKEILNQTLITSSVEIIKFNRGDYVSA